MLGLGLAQRDGLIVLIGLAASVAAIGAVSFVTVMFFQSLPGLVGLFPLE